MRPKVRVLCLPDVDRAIGGVKQLYRHVEHLVALGWDAAIVTEKSGFRPSWFASSAPSFSFAECCQRSDFVPSQTILLLPETYLGVDFGSFRERNLSSLARVVFNQNAYYTYSQPKNDLDAQLDYFYNNPSVLHVLSVSEDTHNFLRANLLIGDSRVSRIVNAIEPIFVPDKTPQNRLHWMPRKNPGEVHAVLSSIKSSHLNHSSGWQGEPLIDLSHNKVAERLNTARLFLAFGHPEGFGLPIAEAMAAGCWVVGYSGGGGQELFRFGASEEVAFGDWTGFAAAVQSAFTAFALYPRETELRLKRQALAVRSLYSFEEERATISLAWERIEVSFKRWLESSSS